MTWIISEQVLRFEGIATFFFFWKGQWFLFQSFQARILHRHFWRFWEILCPNFYRLIRKTSMLDRCVLVFFLFFFPVLCEKTAHLFSRLTPKRRAQVSLSLTVDTFCDVAVIDRFRLLTSFSCRHSRSTNHMATGVFDKVPLQLLWPVKEFCKIVALRLTSSDEPNGFLLHFLIKSFSQHFVSSFF